MIMGRLKGYLVYLLIPAFPYLLMIYSPETIDPVFQYLKHGKGSKYVLAGMVFVFNWSLYFGIAFDARKEKVSERNIRYTKLYLALLAAVSAYFLIFLNTFTVQNIFLANTGLIVVFYTLLISFGKKNT